MAFFYTFSVILIFWALVYALNTFLIECSFTSARYAKILSKKGLSINLFQIKWYTVKCNRLFVKLSNWKPRFLMWWFNAGVVFGLIGQVGSIFLVSYTLIDFFRSKPTNEQILVPVVRYNFINTERPRLHASGWDHLRPNIFSANLVLVAIFKTMMKKNSH